MPSGRDVSDVSEFNMHKRSSEKYPRDRRLGTGLEPAERLPVAVSSCIPYMSCYILATSAQLLNSKIGGLVHLLSSTLAKMYDIFYTF
ncbi:Hypothetical protein NTJ_03174 [Nesidiocoris tenuis]|uniref:Uncharacterized protein n=1 Tax=Nesidiocoris tenuis TaxID=355587 RepID=A0ABN7ADL1_9HEMI|nr:Hypothetical protein NTJ_03174 [Nesidiocoris tenuis]